MVQIIFILRAGNKNVSPRLHFAHVALVLEINYAPIYMYEEIIRGRIVTTSRKIFTQTNVVYTQPRDVKPNCVYDFN